MKIQKRNGNLVNLSLDKICYRLKKLATDKSLGQLKTIDTDVYKNILTINTGLKINDSDFYKIGYGYSSPLSSGDPKLKVSLKDIHTQGSLTAPTTKVSIPPFIFPQPETYYIIQSPSSGKIAIGIPDPIVDGYLMHK